MDDKLFTGSNYKLLGIGIALLAVGYVLLGQGPVYNHLSWSVAPVILAVAYCIVLPLVVAYKGKKNEAGKKGGKK
jgi:hypothetical protein